MLNLLLMIAACIPTYAPGPVASQITREPTRLIVDRDPENSDFFLTAAIRAGAAYDPVGQEGLAYIVGHTLHRDQSIEGPKNQNGQATNLATRDFSVAVGMETIELSVRCQPSDALLCTKAFAQALTQPRFNESNIESVRLTAVDTLNHWHGELHNTLPSELLRVMVYEGHRLGNPIEGRIGTLPLITSDHAQRFYDTHFVRSNVVVGVQGNFDEAVLDLLNESLRQLDPSAAPALRESTLQQDNGPMVRIVPTTSKTTTIRLGVPIDPAIRDEERIALWVGLDVIRDRLQQRQNTTVRPNPDEAVPNGAPTPLTTAFHHFGETLFNLDYFEFGLTLPDSNNFAAPLSKLVLELHAAANTGIEAKEFNTTVENIRARYSQQHLEASEHLDLRVSKELSPQKRSHLSVPEQLDQIELSTVNQALQVHVGALEPYVVIVTNSPDIKMDSVIEETATKNVNDTNNDGEATDSNSTATKKTLQRLSKHAKVVEMQRLFQ